MPQLRTDNLGISYLPEGGRKRLMECGLLRTFRKEEPLKKEHSFIAILGQKVNQYFLQILLNSGVIPICYFNIQ